jgi:hypothetical protein
MLTSQPLGPLGEKEIPRRAARVTPLLAHNSSFHPTKTENPAEPLRLEQEQKPRRSKKTPKTRGH